MGHVNGNGNGALAPEAHVVVENVVKVYGAGGEGRPVLDGISLRVARGEFLSIVGPSGSGKSTLLNLIAGIDRPTSGQVNVGGAPIHEMSEEQLAKWRGTELGIIFQFFQMLPGLSLLHNVMLPMDLARRYPAQERRERAMHLLEQVEMAEHAGKLPSQVSGGQQQRAAIARALANDPPLIVADEPTGNVDTASAERLFTLFEGVVRAGKTLLMVTHNEELAERATRRIEIRDGAIVRNGPTLARREEPHYERYLV